MRFHIRINKETEQHIFLTLFTNGKNNGELCFSPMEADEFCNIVESGCSKELHDYQLTYLPREMMENPNDPK